MVRFLLRRSLQVSCIGCELIPHSAVDLMDRYVMQCGEWDPGWVFPCLFLARKLHDTNPFNGGRIFDERSCVSCPDGTGDSWMVSRPLHDFFYASLKSLIK